MTASDFCAVRYISSCQGAIQHMNRRESGLAHYRKPDREIREPMRGFS
jgi:hypothetical protein